MSMENLSCVQQQAKINDIFWTCKTRKISQPYHNTYIKTNKVILMWQQTPDKRSQSQLPAVRVDLKVEKKLSFTSNNTCT